MCACENKVKYYLTLFFTPGQPARGLSCLGVYLQSVSKNIVFSYNLYLFPLYTCNKLLFVSLFYLQIVTNGLQTT